MCAFKIKEERKKKFEELFNKCFMEDFILKTKDEVICEKIFGDMKISKYRVDNTIYEDKEFLIQDPDGYLLRFNN